MFGCKKYDDDYKKYLDNREVTYPGLATNLHYNTGNLRVQLIWRPSPDPSIKRYVVIWNNGADSLNVDATTTDPADSITVIVPGLKEYVYSFKLKAYDAEGRVSVGQELNNVRVYGSAFTATLLNRGYKVAGPYTVNNDGTISLNFNKPDTGNVYTTIKYTNTLNLPEERRLNVNQSSIVIPNYKKGTAVQYRSAYVPLQASIDTFNVATYEDFPEIKIYTPLDKSLFKTFNLPNDIGSAYGWEVYYLWNGKTDESQGQGFHTGNAPVPFWYTFDMGQTTSLTKIQIWQRMSGLFNYGNVKRFEIWGSNNPDPNGDYNNWTMLGSFTSVKPSDLPVGQNTDADRDYAAAGESFLFPDNVPEVRYIRFKILETWGNTNYYHMMELSLFK
ncbi:DUF4998 domain-containing protein [Mucilaginibacter gynuensis]|uniref:DUF4998 domain-containing protein n=2 Tax=Mucilaginibacter gynuensis TaxID=1302236 RepID=A0ABP8FMZ5_9SPHI